MKKLIMFFLIGIALIMPKIIKADSIIGCPLGVDKGKLWIMNISMYNAADKAYWNENHSDAPKMVELPAGWHSYNTKSSLRIGYGVTSRISIDFLTSYWNKNISKQVWKQKPNNQWFKKSVSIKAHGFEDVWVTGLVKIVKDHPIWQAISFGVGVKFDASDDSLVTKGIGTGTKDFRVAFLTHENISSRLALCDDIWYEYRGKVRDIYIKNDACETIKWEKSGTDIGDAVGYRFNFEYDINKKGNYQIHFAIRGWYKLADKNSGKEMPNTKYYDNSIQLKFAYLPNGGDNEHQKAFVGVKIPVYVQTGFSSAITPLISLMWTF